MKLSTIETTLEVVEKPKSKKEFLHYYAPPNNIAFCGLDVSDLPKCPHEEWDCVCHVNETLCPECSFRYEGGQR